MRMQAVFLVISSLALLGCGNDTPLFAKKKAPDAKMVAVMVPPEDTPRPKPRPGQDNADLSAIEIVSPEEVAAANRPIARPEQDLGKTIVSLGLLDRDGLWLRTPLIQSEAAGRVVYNKTGASANVTLLPLKAETGAGSHLSLAAMQILGVPLVELAEVQVYVR